MYLIRLVKEVLRVNSISIVGENAYLYPDFSFNLTKSSNDNIIALYSDLYPLTLYKLLLDYLLKNLTGETVYNETLPDGFETMDIYITSFLERMITLDILGGDERKEKEEILQKNRESYNDKEIAFLNYSYMFYLPTREQFIHIKEDISDLYKLADITQLFFALKGSYNVSLLKENADKLQALYATLSMPLVPFNGYSCKLTALRFEDKKFIALSRFTEEFMRNNHASYKISIGNELPTKQLSFSKLLMIYIASRKMELSHEEYPIEKAFVLYTYDVNGNPTTQFQAKPGISFCEIYRDKLVKLENYKVSDSLAALLSKYISKKIFFEKISFLLNLISPVISLFSFLRKKRDDSDVER